MPFEQKNRKGYEEYSLKIAKEYASWVLLHTDDPAKSQSQHLATEQTSPKGEGGGQGVESGRTFKSRSRWTV